MIEILVEEVMSTASAVDMNPTGKPKKKKCETFSVSDAVSYTHLTLPTIVLV